MSDITRAEVDLLLKRTELNTAQIELITNRQAQMQEDLSRLLVELKKARIDRQVRR